MKNIDTVRQNAENAGTQCGLGLYYLDKAEASCKVEPEDYNGKMYKYMV